MRCPDCHAEVVAEDLFCRQCGAELAPSNNNILVPSKSGLPAIISNARLPQRVAAGVGAMAVGLGLEILRRALLAYISQPSRKVASVAPGLDAIKDVIQPKKEKTTRVPKGYEVHETVVYMQRVIRRVD